MTKLKIQTDEIVLANSPDLVLNKKEETTVVIDVAIPSREKERERSEKKAGTNVDDDGHRVTPSWEIGSSRFQAQLPKSLF